MIHQRNNESDFETRLAALEARASEEHAEVAEALQAILAYLREQRRACQQERAALDRAIGNLVGLAHEDR